MIPSLPPVLDWFSFVVALFYIARLAIAFLKSRYVIRRIGKEAQKRQTPQPEQHKHWTVK